MTAMPAVFAYLLAQLPSLVATADPTALVCDGWPDESRDRLLVIGRKASEQGDAVDNGALSFVELGARHVIEDFSIPCYVDCFSGDDDQSLTRAAAFVLYSVVDDLIRADRTLGGALNGGRIARIDTVTLHQTPDEENAQSGRRAVLAFAIRCQNRY